MKQALPTAYAATFARWTFTRWTFALWTGACSQAPQAQAVEYDLPSRDTFSAVSSVLEVSCGTLDCHGSPARRLRVYGTRGLRFSGDDVTGVAATTPLELDATYDSVVSLDPEILAGIVATGEGLNDWLLLAKGRASIAHKGGPALKQRDEGDECVVSWLLGEVDVLACVEHSLVPITRPGEEW